MLPLFLPYISIILLELCVVVKNEEIRLSRHERSLIFGSSDQVTKYQLVYLPVPSGRPQGPRRRDVFPYSCQPLQVNFTAFDKKIGLYLKLNEKLTPPFLVVTRVNGSAFIEPELNDINSGCHYHGDILTSPGGKAALSLQHGFTGFVETNDGEHLLLKPAPRRLQLRNAVNTKVPHIIYQTQPPTTDVQSCGQQSSDDGREKRSFYQVQPTYNKLNIETAVFVDKDMYELMKQNFPADPDRGVIEVVLAMINAAQLLFQDQTLQSNIELSLIRLEIQKSEFQGLKRSENIDQYLSNFCTWQKTINPPDDSDPLHWDHALLLTGANLYSEDGDGVKNNQVVGLAPVSGMCLLGNSCTVNEGGHFEAVYVIAHEIGHSMGMQHDGPQNSNNCDKNKFIMSPTLGSGKTTWSTCSKNYLIKFLRSHQSRCLWDPGLSPEHLDHQRNVLLPGQRFHADQQCRLRFGTASTRDSSQNIGEICQDLRCLTDNYPLTSHPALEGSYCGENKYCRSGVCVEKPTEKSLKPQNGNWGSWSPFGPCASSCLLTPGKDFSVDDNGISVSSRRCDNPHPQIGGKPCQGVHQRYKLCRPTQPCPPHSKLTTNQYASHICSSAALGNPQLSGHGRQMDNADEIDACSIWCTKISGGFVSNNWRFPDGTRCKLRGSQAEEYLSFCVDGKCLKLDDEDEFLRSNDFKSSISSSGTNFEWEAVSTCVYGCTYGTGIRSVKRKCDILSKSCSEIESYQLCDSFQKCMNNQTPKEYADGVCENLKLTYSQLSGLGEQLDKLSHDHNLPCFVSCQDSTNKTKFYKIDNFDAGMFGIGTKCTSNEEINPGFCLRGECLEFGVDGLAIKEKNLRSRRDDLSSNSIELVTEKYVKKPNTHQMFVISFRDELSKSKNSSTVE